MKKSLKKILFTILTVFSILFILACNNKKEVKINKEEILKNFVEASNNIKSADILIDVKMVPKDNEEAMELLIDTSVITEPITMKMTMEFKEQDLKILSFIKEDNMYLQNPIDKTWVKQPLPEETAMQFKTMVNDSNDTYELLKDHLDKVDIKQEGQDYIISVTKDTDFLKESMKEKRSKVNMVAQEEELEVDNVTMEYIIDKETYLSRSSVIAFDTNIEGQEIRMTIDSKMSNINNIQEITLPEETQSAITMPVN